MNAVPLERHHRRSALSANSSPPFFAVASFLT